MRLRPLVFVLTALASHALFAQTITYSASGLGASNAITTLRIDALRPDVLRIRMYPLGHPAEDASWAVLASARQSHAPIKPEANGFSTSVLHVKVGPDLKLEITDMAGKIVQADAAPVAFGTGESGAGFTVVKRIAPDDHFFGLGDKPGPLDRAGRSFVMWNTDHFAWQESTDPIYKDIPFFLDFRAGRALGVLFDNTFRAFFDFGHETADHLRYSASDGPLDYYLLYGPDPKQVVTAYAWLTGPTPLPPAWVLGYQQSRWAYFPATQVEEIAAHLRADHIPADAIYLDIDYQVKDRPFTVDPVAFPDFPGLIHKLAAEHFHTVAITDLHIADLPHQGYAPYDSGEAGNHFIQLNGRDYVGPVWPGPSVFPDFTRQGTRDWWGSLYKQFVDDGVAGFWNDMNEPAVFDPSKTMPLAAEDRIDEPGFARRLTTQREIHNVYGMQNSRATWDGLLRLRPNQRPFVLTRASYAGGQRYAATWTGDNDSTWNHLRQTTPQLLNLGLSGFALSGADVGGFAGSPSPELLTRWLTLAAFQPIDRDHASKGTRPHEPWVDGPEQEAIRRRYIEERYRLMPYLYTTAEETSRDGLPITRPLFLQAPHATADSHPLDLDAPGEFFFGPSILVADSPSPDQVAPYEVHLPPGLWYDYWTAKPLDRRERNVAQATTLDPEVKAAAATPSPAVLPPLLVHPGLADLPMYVRAGAIIPMAPLVESTDQRPQGPLTIRVFPPASPGDPCEGDLYQDDGDSYNFRQGAYLRLHFTCALAPDGGLRVDIPARQGSFHPWWTSFRIELAGWTPVQKTATMKTRTVPLEQTPLGWAATIPDTAQPATILFH